MAQLIFDVDGTLVDSSALTVSVITHIMERFSHLQVPAPAAIMDTFGLSEQEMWQRLMPEGLKEERRQASALYDIEIVSVLQRSDII